VASKQRVQFWLWVVGVFIVLLIVHFGFPGGSSSSNPSSNPSSNSSSDQANGNYGYVAASPSGGTVAGSLHYETVGSEVRLREAATTGSAIVTTMRPYGAGVVLSCYEYGQSVFGDSTWYRASYGLLNGYVAGYWVDTGPDPASDSLPICG
jgi:hypothetical protein